MFFVESVTLACSENKINHSAQNMRSRRLARMNSSRNDESALVGEFSCWTIFPRYRKTIFVISKIDIRIFVLFVVFKLHSFWKRWWQIVREIGLDIVCDSSC